MCYKKQVYKIVLGINVEICCGFVNGKDCCRFVNGKDCSLYIGLLLEIEKKNCYSLDVVDFFYKMG